MSLALATLIHEWRRYTAAVAALAFSGLLILAQIGMFTGLIQGVTATIDRSRADIMVLPAKIESLVNSGGGGLPARIGPRLYLHPEVVEVASWDNGSGQWVNRPKPGEKAVTTFVNINMVDTRAGAVNLPVDFSEATRAALQEPYALAIDESQLKRLGVGLGDAASINGRTVWVRAILTGYPDINNPSVVASRDTLRLLGLLSKDGKTGPLMVRVSDPARAEIVRDQLNAEADGAFRAWTRQELADANQAAILEEQIIGIFLTFSLVLGVLIGVGITSQTLRGAILSSIREFASLRALGVSMGSLRGVVMELSLWVGLVGLASTGLLTVGLWLLATSNGVPMGFPPHWVALVAVMLLAISAASGFLAVGVLKKSQPADLLR